MKTKSILFVVILFASAIAGLMLLNRPASPQKTEVVPPQSVVAPQQPSPPPAPPVEKPVVTPPKTEPARAESKPQVATNQTASADEPHTDQLARIALSLVGVDPDAEAYWASAIFDTSLSDPEREDLMEDLNEDGLSDPKHPGPEDLPLILNRLAIIEEVAPYADPFMLEHLGEAYKDLNNLLSASR